METNRLYRIAPQFVLGMIIIIVGVLFTLDNLRVLYAEEYLRYWPALIIIYGLVRIAQPRGTQGRFGGLVWLLIGIALLIDTLGFLGLRLRDLWPLLLVLFGFLILRRSWGPRTALPADTDSGSTSTSDNFISGFALMSGVRRTVTSKDFRGGNLTAIMGGCEVDLRQASIAGGTAVLDIFAFWGGIDIRVPQDWTVIVEGTPFLGGFEDETRQESVTSSKRLVIKGVAIMGGAEIKN